MEDHDEDDEPTFFQRHRMVLIGGGVVLIGAIAYFAITAKPGTKKRSSVSMVDIMPPMPPPPPPPPPPTPPPEVEPPPDQAKPEFQEEKQPEAAPPPEAPPEAAAPLGTDLQGEGGPDFGLAKGGGGGMIGGTGKGGGGGGTKYGWYAGQVQSVVASAIQGNKRTRSVSATFKVRIWVDSSGRVTRAKLSGSTGNDAADRALQSEVLNGLQLQEPPPADMPMPIVMRITAKRPN